MLNPVNQMGTPSPQMPLSLLRQRPADDWLLAQPGDPAPRASAVNPLDRVPLAFLRRLAADDRLRAELEIDPAGTLARHGVHTPPEAIPAAVSLPSREALEEMLRATSTQEDQSIQRYYAGFLGGLVDSLISTGDD